MDVILEVLTADGWGECEFSSVESVQVAAAPAPEGLELTLIGERNDGENQVETGILDVARRHEDLLVNSVPRVDSGESVPAAYRGEGPGLSDLSEMLDDTA
jgi:hypothetical protein